MVRGRSPSAQAGEAQAMSSGRPPEEWDPKLQMQRAWEERLERGWAELEDLMACCLRIRQAIEYLPAGQPPMEPETLHQRHAS